MAGEPDDAEANHRGLDDAAAGWRVDEAAAARRRTHDLQAQAAESATFAGLLVDAAERHATVVVHGPAGRIHRGTIASVGADFVELRASAARHFVVLEAITGVSFPDDPARTPTDRAPEHAAELIAVLADLAVERARLTVRDWNGQVLSGILTGVGQDVLRLQLDGHAAGTAYVALWSLAEASATGSG